MHMNRITLLLVAACLMIPTESARAEKAPLSKKQLEKTATHIVVGKVKAIYSRLEREGWYEYKRYVAEVDVSKHEKGDEEAKIMYVRYFDVRWKGLGPMPPGPGGHWPAPEVGESYRFYLAKNAYDGFASKNDDGGFNVIYGNGIQKVD